MGQGGAGDLALRLAMLECVVDAVVEVSGLSKEAVLDKAKQLFKEVTSKDKQGGADSEEPARDCDNDFREKLAHDRAIGKFSKLVIPDDDGWF